MRNPVHAKMTSMYKPIAERRTAVLFAGGGMKGALQVGYSQYMIRERQWPIRWVRGVSTGALQAVMLAHGQDLGLTYLEALWLGLTKRSDLFETRGFLGKVWGLFSGTSLASNEPLFRLLKRSVKVSEVVASGVDVKVGTVNFNTKSFHEVGPNDVPEEMFLRFTLASTSIPGEFPGQWIVGAMPFSDGWYFDGGTMNVMPTLDGLIEAGADRIVLCLCNPINLPPDKGRYDSTIPILKEAMSIALHDNYAGDLLRMQDSVEAVNAKILAKEPGYGDKRLIDFIILAPDGDAPIGTLEVDPAKIRDCIELGRRIARLAITRYYIDGSKH